MFFTRMGLISYVILVISLVECQLAFAEDGIGTIRFFPATGVEASLLVQVHEVHVKLSGARGSSSAVISVETEKALKISLEDYDFDGHKDFAVSHLDDGMGTYEIYQVYIYSLQEGKFISLRPPCGDEFVNLFVNKRERTLVNSYISDNGFKTCKKKF